MLLIEMGVGKRGIAKLREMLNMPFSLSVSTWYGHEEVLSKAYEEKLQEKIENKQS